MFTIVKLLEHPRDVKKHLPREIDSLRSGLLKCVSAIETVEGEFDTWRRMAKELVRKATLEDRKDPRLSRPCFWLIVSRPSCGSK